MRYLKSYKIFESSDNDLQIEFLSLIPEYEKTILKVVNVHENHYYKDSKISTNEDFLKGVKELSKKILNKELVMCEEYLSLVRKYEKELYQKDEMGLGDYDEEIDGFEEQIDESMFGIIDDLVGGFQSVMRRLNERQIKYFKSNIDSTNRIDDSWVYKQSMSDTLDNIKTELEEMDFDWVEEDENDLLPWSSDEEAFKDIEQHFGKKLEEFDYNDRVNMLEYIEHRLGEFDVPDDIIKAYIEQIKKGLF